MIIALIMSDNTISLVPGRTDKDLADDLRAKLIEAMKPVLAVLDDAKAAGFVVGFACGVDFLGKSVMTQLTIAKNY